MKSKKLERRAMRRLAAAVALVSSVPEACARDPDRDLMRSRKIPLYTLLHIIITWGRFVLYGVDGTDVPPRPSSDPRTRITSNQSGAARNT